MLLLVARAYGRMVQRGLTLSYKRKPRANGQHYDTSNKSVDHTDFGLLNLLSF